jgi:indolepyruvate ferredoxin oxidoreductase
MKIAKSSDGISAVRVAAGAADLILGCDLVTAASARILKGASTARTHAVVNTHETMPAQFTRSADLRLPGEEMQLKIAARVKKDAFHAIDASTLATDLIGDSIAVNLFTLGYAWQKGLIPLGSAAIEEAIRLNGTAVKMNLDAFLWGRRAAADLQAVKAVVARPDETRAETLDEIVARRVSFLTDYQNRAYADDYRAFVSKIRERESQVKKGSEELTSAVARYLFKLMAYKDEYEVARLHAGAEFAKALGSKFKGGRLTFHLAPPLLARRDPVTGVPRKMTFGPWMMSAFRLLAKLKFLRGTAFDPFGRSAERRMERALIGEYRARIDSLLDKLTPSNLALAAEIASVPEHIRGYGHVKTNYLKTAKAHEAELLVAWQDGRAPKAQAAE